jgi:hypothetical protein
MIISGIVQATILASGVLLATGAQTQSCKDMVYENRNQIDYGRPVQVTALFGAAQDMEKVRVPKACVGIFTEPEHRLVAAETTENGEFEIRGVPNGDYRIVVKYNGFCPANALVRLRQRSGRGKPLIVHMRPAGIDTCSYVDKK